MGNVGEVKSKNTSTSAALIALIFAINRNNKWLHYPFDQACLLL